jgi:hypothetical protein
MPTSPDRSPILALLDRVALAPRQAAKQLTLWPLVATEDPAARCAPEYVTLAEAIEAGHVRVEEVGSAGQVPHVLVANGGDRAVLVLFGEEIRGAKQNRIANASFLVGARSEVVIDVSCVEAGRWAQRDAVRFSAARSVASHALRKKMALKVAMARELGRSFDADQSEVWDEVAIRLGRSATRSRTSSYADYVGTRESELRALDGAFHAAPLQVGFVASIGDEVAGVEAIGRPEVFARAFDGLLRGYLIDAIDHALVREREDPAPAAGFDAPEMLLAALRSSRAKASPSLGLGTDLRIRGERVAGCALVLGEVVHLTAFPSMENAPPRFA